MALGPAAHAAPRRREAGSSGIGIQLLEGPASKKDDPRASRYIVDHLHPGTSIRRKIQVWNNSGERNRIDVYSGSATLAQEAFVFGEGSAGNELTSWFSFDKDRLDLAPGDKAVVEVTIAVPPTASIGERYGLVWASVVPPSKAAKGVTLATRVGVRVYLDIGKGGEPPSDFDITGLTPARSLEGVPSLTATVTNTGGRALDISGWVDLHDGPASQRAGPFQVTNGPTLAVGATGHVIVQFPKELPNGPWKVSLSLRSGLVVHAVTGEIRFPNAGDVGKPGTFLNNSGVIAGGASTVAFIVLLLLILLARRHRRTSRAAR